MEEETDKINLKQDKYCTNILYLIFMKFEILYCFFMLYKNHIYIYFINL